MQMLLEKGASKDCHDDFGITPLFVAAQYGQLESLRLLLSHGNHNPSVPLLQFHQLPLNAILALLLHVIISNIRGFISLLLWKLAEFEATLEK